MASSLWSYVTPGIPDDLFERLPGIPMSQREIRVLLLSALRLKPNSVLWDIGAGTGTISIEAALLCAQGRVVAVERDEDVANLIQRNCDRFGAVNVEVIVGNAPECLAGVMPRPDRILIGGGRSLKDILATAWQMLPIGGRVVVTAANLETLYQVSEGLSQLQVRNLDVVQSSINRLEKRGVHQIFAAIDPIFILSGEKLE